MNELDRLVGELETLHEALNDLAMSLLSEAIDNGETSRPAAEKRVSQARRSVAKAIEQLRGAGAD